MYFMCNRVVLTGGDSSKLFFIFIILNSSKIGLDFGEKAYP